MSSNDVGFVFTILLLAWNLTKSGIFGKRGFFEKFNYQSHSLSNSTTGDYQLLMKF